MKITGEEEKRRTLSITLPIRSNFITSELDHPSGGIEDVPRTCPLCKAVVRLFFVNLNDKILMCENTDCQFPFGIEDIQFFKEDLLMEEDEEIASIRSNQGRGSPTFSGSVTSMGAWTEIDKMNRVYESEDSQYDSRSYVKDDDETLIRRKVAKEKREEIQRNINNIKEMNMTLAGPDENDHTIRNERWIRNLLVLQEMSGVMLLRQRELEKLKKKEPVIGLGELKIDIDRQEPMSAIRIEISNL